METKTLEDVQVGDQVLWVGHYNKRILTVTRLTHTTIICEHEKFRKENGWATPMDMWGRSYIEVLTPEKRVQLELEQRQIKLINKCQNAPYNKFTIEILEEISNLIDKANSEEHVE